MKITFDIKPYSIKETHYSNLKDAISEVMAQYGCWTYSNYGSYRSPIPLRNSKDCYVYSVETFKRGTGKYRGKPKQVFRIYKFNTDFLAAGKLKLVQKSRYFRLQNIK